MQFDFWAQLSRAVLKTAPTKKTGGFELAWENEGGNSNRHKEFLHALTRNQFESNLTWVRIPPAAPNKHRDFDTKSRCSIYVPKPKNTGIFNVYFVLLIPQWSFVPLGNCLFQVPNQ